MFRDMYAGRPVTELFDRLDHIERVLDLLCERQGMSREFIEEELADRKLKTDYERSKKALIARDR